MGDWQIIQHLFGDEAGPLPVLLIFDENTSKEDIKALNHNFSFRYNPFDQFDDEVRDFKEEFGNQIKELFGINTNSDNMYLLEFNNERSLRADGSAFLMKLVTNGNLIAAYKMSEGDRSGFTELDRQLYEIREINNLCDEFRSKLEQHMFWKTNNPADYVRNHSSLVESFGHFDHEMAEGLSHLDIDHSATRAYEGPYNDLLASLIAAPTRALDEHLTKMRAFVQTLKIV